MGGGGLLGLVNIDNLKLAGNVKSSWYNIAYRWLVPLQIACVLFLCCEEKCQRVQFRVAITGLKKLE